MTVQISQPGPVSALFDLCARALGQVFVDTTVYVNGMLSHGSPSNVRSGYTVCFLFHFLARTLSA